MVFGDGTKWDSPLFPKLPNNPIFLVGVGSHSLINRLYEIAKVPHHHLHPHHEAPTVLNRSVGMKFWSFLYWECFFDGSTHLLTGWTINAHNYQLAKQAMYNSQLTKQAMHSPANLPNQGCQCECGLPLLPGCLQSTVVDFEKKMKHNPAFSIHSVWRCSEPQL